MNRIKQKREKHFQQERKEVDLPEGKRDGMTCSWKLQAVHMRLQGKNARKSPVEVGRDQVVR